MQYVVDQKEQYKIFFKKTIEPYEEPRTYLKLHLFSNWIWESMDNYLKTVIYTSTLMEYLDEELYDAGNTGLGFDVSCTTYGWLTISASGYSQKVLVLLKKVLELSQFIPSDKDLPEWVYLSQESYLSTVLERKKKTWYNSAFKRSPLEQ